MFLVDSALTGADWDGIIAAIRAILERTGAEIVSIRKWDDRRLAYEINRKTRGTYILCYFRADGEKIQDIEKAVQLSEQIMRVLILSTEQLTAEDIEKDTPATKVEKEKEKRKAAKETAQEAEVEQVSAPEKAGEAEKAEGVEKMEETKQSPEEKTEDSQESEVSAGPEVSTVTDDLMEKQPEQDQIEGSEQS
jgi:small subunit ribosomal protein S6